MKALELQSPALLRLSEIAIPKVADDGILLRTKAVSICSTDISYFHGNLYPNRYPVVLGHEYLGVVEKVGIHQDRKLIGERVVYFGQTDFGGLAQYRAIRPLFSHQQAKEPFETERNFKDDRRAAAIILPHDVHDDEATLLEPITAVLRAILTRPPEIGDRVLILGGGPCGTIAGMVMKHLYAVSEVAVLERNIHRQNIAERSYADKIFSDAVDLAFDQGGSAYDYVFDALPPIPDVSVDDDPRRSAMLRARPGATYLLYQRER